MIRAHREALVERLSTWRVYSDRMKLVDDDFPTPYIIVEFPPPLRESERFAQRDAAVGRSTVQVSCVGESTEQADWLYERVEAALLGWTPVVPGWRCYPLRQTLNPLTLPPFTDVPDRRLITHVSQFLWRAERA